jgi:hypothetical protein
VPIDSPVSSAGISAGGLVNSDLRIEKLIPSQAPGLSRGVVDGQDLPYHDAWAGGHAGERTAGMPGIQGWAVRVISKSGAENPFVVLV